MKFVRTITKKISFGYTNECNLNCAHCIMGKELKTHKTMTLETAKFFLSNLASECVRIICFTAGESLLFPDDINSLIKDASQNGCYTVLSTNAYWASNKKNSRMVIRRLKNSGLSQLRISFSRWHQKFIDKENIINASSECENSGLYHYISFVTDFSKLDSQYKKFLVNHRLRYNPEPIIYSGFAKYFKKTNVINESSAYSCKMTPYISPELNVFACCDAGTKFSETEFFNIGSLLKDSPKEILNRIENNILLKLIRTLGLKKMAAKIGIEKNKYSDKTKCDLCELLFNSKSNLNLLTQAFQLSNLS